MAKSQPVNQPVLQAGFTLLELLISITIGMILMLAATSMVISTAESRRIVRYTAELQEEAFYIAHIIKQQLAQSGFRSIVMPTGASRAIPIANRDVHFPAVAGRWTDGQLVNATGNTLWYRFDGASRPDGTPDGSIYDCLGNAIPAGAIVESSISVQGNDLLCTVGGTTELLVDGSNGTRVEGMQITLGVDSNGDGEVDRIPGTATATNADFQNAINITVRILLASEDNAINHNQTYFFNGPITATDNRLRVESVASVALRH